jgi:hypothetical protein
MVKGGLVFRKKCIVVCRRLSPSWLTGRFVGVAHRAYWWTWAGPCPISTGKLTFQHFFTRLPRQRGRLAFQLRGQAFLGGKGRPHCPVDPRAHFHGRAGGNPYAGRHPQGRRRLRLHGQEMKTAIFSTI